jgi:glutamate/aspartate transport system ATP-binding protein
MIEINNISKWYGSFQVLTDNTLSIDKGDETVVCGPSGSGKSTLGKTINGLEPFQKGQIILDGISVGDPKTDLPKLRARVGMVFQNFELFPHMTGRDNLIFAQVKVLRRSASDASKQALKYLNRVGLEDQKEKFQGSCRVDNNSALPLRALWPWTLFVCCSMSPLRPWTRKWLVRFWMSWSTWPARA